MNEQAPNVIDTITEDHREFESLFALAREQQDPAEFKRIADLTIAELIRHAVAEEMYLYPAFRDYLPDGDELASHEIEEHAEAERTMKEIEGLDANDPQLRQKFNELVELITHHVADEEQNSLPRLRAACSEEQLRDLGQKVLRAKDLAPTRPHPSAPDTPPLNKLLAPGTGLIDRIRDAMSGRQT
jgi:hemerythrin superfamily protein